MYHASLSVISYKCWLQTSWR